MLRQSNYVYMAGILLVVAGCGDAGSGAGGADASASEEERPDGAPTADASPVGTDAGDSEDGCDPLPEPPGSVVIDLGDEGLSEGDVIDGYLEEHLADDHQLRIPAGTYTWNGGGLTGTWNDASIIGEGEVVLAAEEGHNFNTNIQTDTVFELRNITQTGQGGAGNDKWRFAAESEDAVLWVRNFRLPDGSADGERVGVRVDSDHVGTLHLIDVHIEGFADNGLYTSGSAVGPVHVLRGFYRNNNISNVRVGTDGSSVRGTVIVNDAESPESSTGARNQRGLRIRLAGRDIVIDNVDIYHGVNNGNAPFEIHRDAEGGEGVVTNVRIYNEHDSPTIAVDGGTYTGGDIHLTGSGNLDIEGGDFDDVCRGEGCDAPRTDPRPACL